jgi:hypothetical protein
MLFIYNESEAQEYVIETAECLLLVFFSTNFI